MSPSTPPASLSDLILRLPPLPSEKAVSTALEAADWSAVTDDDVRALRDLLTGLELRDGVGAAHRLASQRLLTDRGDRTIVHPGGDFSDTDVCALDPTGRYLAAGTDGYGNPGDRGELTLWETASGRCVNRAAVLPGGVGTGEDEPPMVWHPSGRRLATSYDSGEVGIFDPFGDGGDPTLEDGWVELAMTSGDAHLQWSPDGTWLSVVMYDLDEDRTDCERHDGQCALPVVVSRVGIDPHGTRDTWEASWQLCETDGVPADLDGPVHPHQVLWSLDGDHVAAGGLVFPLVGDGARQAEPRRRWTAADFAVPAESVPPVPAEVRDRLVPPPYGNQEDLWLADDGATVVTWNSRSLCFWDADTGRLRAAHDRSLGDAAADPHVGWSHKDHAARGTGPLAQGLWDYGRQGPFEVDPTLPVRVDGRWEWIVVFPTGLVVCPPTARERLASLVSFALDHRVAWPAHWAEGTALFEVHEGWRTAVASPLLPAEFPDSLRRQLIGTPDPDRERGLRRVTAEEFERDDSLVRGVPLGELPSSFLVALHPAEHYETDRRFSGDELTPELLRSLVGTVVRIRYTVGDRFGDRIVTLLRVDDTSLVYRQSGLVDGFPVERLAMVATVRYRPSS